MADIYNANTGEPINNGSVVVKIPKGEPQSYKERAFHTPEIADLSGQYDNKGAFYKRYYTGDTDD
jgi:hypothetical protein